MNDKETVPPTPMAISCQGRISAVCNRSRFRRRAASRKARSDMRPRVLLAMARDRLSLWQSTCECGPSRALRLRYPVADLQRPLLEGIHPAMPRFQLTPSQVMDVMAYLK